MRINILLCNVVQKKWQFKRGSPHSKTCVATPSSVHAAYYSQHDGNTLRGHCEDIFVCTQTEAYTYMCVIDMLSDSA